MIHIVINDFDFKVYKENIVLSGKAQKTNKGLKITLKGNKEVKTSGRTFYELRKNIINKLLKY